MGLGERNWFFGEMGVTELFICFIVIGLEEVSDADFYGGLDGR